MMAVMDTGCNKQKIEAINFKILLFIICNQKSQKRKKKYK